MIPEVGNDPCVDWRLVPWLERADENVDGSRRQLFAAEGSVFQFRFRKSVYNLWTCRASLL